MLPTKFWFIWPSGFRGEDFKKSAKQKQELPKVAMFVNGSELNEQSLEDLPRMLPTKWRFIWQNGFRGEFFLEINQSETRIVCGGHVCKRIRTKWAIFIEDLLPSFDSFGTVVLEETIF